MVGIVAGLGAELTGHNIVGPEPLVTRSRLTAPSAVFRPVPEKLIHLA